MKLIENFKMLCLNTQNETITINNEHGHTVLKNSKKIKKHTRLLRS